MNLRDALRGSGSTAAIKPHTAAQRGAVGDRPKGRRGLRFRDLAQMALAAKEARGIRPLSLRADRLRFSVLDPLIGHLRLSRLKPRTFAHALADVARDRGLTPATFNRYLALCSSVCAFGVREELLAVNPLQDGRVQKRPESGIHVRYLERHEQSQLLAVIKRVCPEKAVEVELAVLCGTRRGELFNARWADWKRKENLLLVEGKTGRREIPLNQAARRCLARMRRRARASEIFITPERNASPVDRRRWFESACKKAGFASKFRYHDLRHTFASRLVSKGVPLLEVQKLAGHRSFQTTLRYAHLSPDHLRKAVEKIRF
jgi:integrase